VSAPSGAESRPIPPAPPGAHAPPRPHPSKRRGDPGRRRPIAEGGGDLAPEIALWGHVCQAHRAAGADHPEQLGGRDLGARGEHGPEGRGRDVEPAVVEGWVLGVGLPPLDVQALGRRPLPAQLDHRGVRSEATTRAPRRPRPRPGSRCRRPRLGPPCPAPPRRPRPGRPRPVLRDMLNGDEQAHDRGDDSGPCAAPTNSHSPSAGRWLHVTLVRAARTHPRPVGAMCRMSGERVSPGMMTDTLSS
jgi:hypothetical protein